MENHYLKPSKLFKETFTGIKWNFFYGILANLVSFFASIFLLKFLLPDDFGLFYLMVMTYSLFEILIDQGYSKAIVHFQKLNQTTLSSIFWINVSIGLVAFILGIILGQLLNTFFKVDKLHVYLPLFSFSYFISTLKIVQVNLLHKDLRFLELSRINFLAICVSSFTAIILAYLKFGVWALVIRTLSFSILSITLIWVISKWRPSFTFSFAALKTVNQYTRSILSIQFIQLVSKQLDSFILGKYLGTYDLGIYNRAKKYTFDISSTLRNKISQVAFSALSKVHGEENQFLELYKYISLILSIIVCPLIVLLVANINFLIDQFFSQEWEALFLPISILGFLALFNGSLIPGILLLAKNRPALNAKLEWTFQIIQIISMLILLYVDKISILNIAILISSVIFVKLIAKNMALTRVLKSKMFSLFSYQYLVPISCAIVLGISMMFDLYFQIDRIYTLLLKNLILIIALISVFYFFFRKRLSNLIDILRG